jgi:hypothetical protein
MILAWTTTWKRKMIINPARLRQDTVRTGRDKDSMSDD